jgi:hypothetical protein
MLIGNKREFAVEFNYRGEPSNGIGHGKIWIGGKFIGTYFDLIYLGSYLLDTLRELIEARELVHEFSSLNKYDLFKAFENGAIESPKKYRVRGSTFTDDFDIRAFQIDNKVSLLWRVHNTDFYQDLKEYGKELHLESVHIDVLLKVTNDFASELLKRKILQ